MNITVERIVPGGLGLGRDDGRAVLLPGTAPGDVVEAHVVAGRARVVRLIERGPDRVIPVCQDVDTCGGCDLMHLDYAAQLSTKVGMLEDCMRRIGRLTSWPTVRVVASPAEVGYRWRAAFHVTVDGTLGYKSRQSSTVVPVRTCHVLHPVLERWRGAFDAGDLPPGSRVAVITDGERVSTAAGGDVEALSLTVGGERHLAAANEFFQANLALVDRLVDEVIRMAEVEADGVAIDLFAGVGLFTIPLARRARAVTAVESDREATDLLRRQLQASGIGNVEIRESRVEAALGHGRFGARLQAVVLDPPRAGAGAAVAKRVARLRPERVVMVSCDPATFARDIEAFAASGYTLSELVLLDMFPQTHHLEVVGLLQPTARG